MVQEALDRIRAEFVEMPGMRLTAAQVQRLCGVDRDVCDAVLRALVDGRFLTRHADGAYSRLTVDTIRHPPPAKVNELSPARRTPDFDAIMAVTRRGSRTRGI